MQVNYRAYPHPVLSYFSDDYVRCLYQTNVMTTVSRNGYQFAVTSKTSSRGLKSLLQSGDAIHAVHIECSATRYRKVFTSDVDVFQVEVPSDDLEGRVQLCSFIIAAKEIDSYTSADFHPDFGERSFKIRKGDVLAVDKDRSFIAEKDHDPLRKLPSIFTISHNLLEDAPPIDLDITGHKIVIKLAIETFSAYKKLAEDVSMQHILSSMIIVPALVSLLETLNAQWVAGGIGEFEERRWYRVLINKLKESGYCIQPSQDMFDDSSLVVAQKLIGNPLLLSMNSLTTLFEDTGGEEE